MAHEDKTHGQLILELRRAEAEIARLQALVLKAEEASNRPCAEGGWETVRDEERGEDLCEQIAELRKARDEAREETLSAETQRDAAVLRGDMWQVDALAANVRASTDLLTGLQNRRAFQDRVSRDFALARSRRGDLSVIMIDVDHFKGINDQGGHALGDKVLVGFADVLRRIVRQGDFVARYGGDEFVMSLPDTPRAVAVVVADRILRAIGGLEIADARGSSVPRVTASLGVGSLRPTDGDAEDLLMRADQALYRAKTQGRNQQVTCED